MKAEVIKTFFDKHKKSLCNKGDIINVSKERFEEINSTAHFIEKVKK